MNLAQIRTHIFQGGLCEHLTDNEWKMYVTENYYAAA